MAAKTKKKRIKSKPTKNASATTPKQIQSRPRTVTIDKMPGRYTSLGYRSATLATTEGRTYSRGSGEAHAKYSREKLQDQSREFIRNNPIYKGMIERAANYIVGNGFALQAKTGDKKVNEKLEGRWKKFWRRPVITNILSGRKTEKMVCKELLTVGDTGILKTKKQKIQLFEAEQIKGKKGYGDDGIEKDEFGTPVKYYLGRYNSNGLVDSRTIKGVKASAFLFLTMPERPSSFRGVPPCQASFPMLHRINDVCDSEAIAWQLLARMAVVLNRKEGSLRGYNDSKPDPDKTGTAAQGSLSTRLTELDYALIFHAEGDEDIKGVERNIPGKNFSESLIMFLRLLGLPLGLPLEIILLDWTKSNYSQSRAVLEQAFTSFTGWQYELSDFFMTPVYEWWLQNEIAAGRIKRTEKIFEHDWLRPSFPWIDQLKEAQAWASKLDRNFTTHQQVCKSLNTDRDDVNKIRKDEVVDAIKIAQDIEKNTGEKVPWQHFCGLEPPKKDLRQQRLEEEEKNKKDGDE